MSKKIPVVFILLMLLTVAGCATTGSVMSGYDSDGSGTVHDPFERFNRAMFGFNHHADSYLLKPLAKGYRYVAPDFVEKGVGNVFSNLREVSNAVNALLQGKPRKAAHYTGRFLLNSTVGIGGLLDVADGTGLQKTEGEDFGQTLGTWGVRSGPYVVLPFFGPSNIRDGISMAADHHTHLVSYVDDASTRDGLRLVNIVNTRAQLLEAEKLLSGDRYIFLRDAYWQTRNYVINDKKAEDQPFDDDAIPSDF